MKERLDYIIISSSLQQLIKEVDILANTISDHSPVFIDLLLNRHNPGKGYWKLNTELLNDEIWQQQVVDTAKEIFSIYKKEEICIAWDILKMNIRQKAIVRGIQLAKARDLKIKALEKKLKAIIIEQEGLFKGTVDTIFDDHDKQISEIRSELDQLYNYRLTGAMLRCKANWVDCGEKPSKYFLQLEKRNFNKKTIFRLQNPKTNKITSSQEEILQILTDYYTVLYSDKKLQLDPDYLALVDFPQVTEKDKIMLDSPISMGEVHAAVKQLKGSKCPGLDGFPAEFYVKFWPVLNKAMHLLIQKNIENNILHNTARDGIISLLDKPDKDHLQVTNWRPLSLLNTDYKIYAKILANRLEKVLPYLISPEQVGFMKGRSIADNLGNLLAVIHHCEKSNDPALILAIDMFKAFDSTQHESVKEILKMYNFGDKFIDMVMICYKEIRSAVMNNNTWKDWIKIQGGLRQGCNLSPKIFLLIMQVISLKIKQNQDIKGIHLKKHEVKSGLCADDIWNTIQYDQSSFQELIHEYEEFSDFVGLKVNYDKTEILRIGSLHNTDAKFISTLPLKWSDGPIKILGTMIHPKYKTLVDENYEKILQNAKDIFNSWTTRAISLLGKIQVVNSLVNSKFVYQLQCLPTPDKKFFRKYKKIVRKFLWDGKKAKIAYDRLILDHGEGGLRLRDLKMTADSLKIAALSRVWSDTPPIWAEHVGTIIPVENNLIPNLCIKGEDVTKNLGPSIFTDMIEAWAKQNYVEPCNSKEVFQQILWCNSHITNNGKWIFQKEMYDSGIMKIIDLYDLDVGRFMTFPEFKQIHPDINITFLDYYAVTKAIPQAWVQLMLRNDMLNEVKSKQNKWLLEFRKNKKKVASFAYCFMRKHLPNKNEALTLIWNNDLKLKMTVKEMSRHFLQINNITLCTKLRFFQYRILSKTLILNVQAVKFVPNISAACSFCNQSPETTVHFFTECTVVKKVWKALKKWSSYFYKVPLDITAEKIIFCNEDKRNARYINLIILVTKFYLYKVRSAGYKPKFVDLVTEINKYKQIDRFIAIKNDKLYKYARKWDDFTVFE